MSFKEFLHDCQKVLSSLTWMLLYNLTSISVKILKAAKQNTKHRTDIFRVYSTCYLDPFMRDVSHASDTSCALVLIRALTAVPANNDNSTYEL